MSSSPEFSKPLQLPISSADLERINAYLSPLTPQDILQWGIEYLPNLYQTTAFGLTGLVAIDMLSKLASSPPPLIFLDTLYHFPETYELVEEVKRQYGVSVHIFKPEGCETTQEFEGKYDKNFWEVDEPGYDYAVKVCSLPNFQSTNLTRLPPYAGGTSTTGVRSFPCAVSHHRPTRVARWGTVISEAARSRQHRVAQAQPALCMELLACRVVHKGECRPTK